MQSVLLSNAPTLFFCFCLLAVTEFDPFKQLIKIVVLEEYPGVLDPRENQLLLRKCVLFDNRWAFQRVTLNGRSISLNLQVYNISHLITCDRQLPLSNGRPVTRFIVDQQLSTSNCRWATVGKRLSTSHLDLFLYNAATLSNVYPVIVSFTKYTVVSK